MAASEFTAEATSTTVFRAPSFLAVTISLLDVFRLTGPFFLCILEKHTAKAGLFSHVLCASYEASHANGQFTTVSHDMQTCKQRVGFNNVTTKDQSTLCQARVTCDGRMHDLRLLQTCRKIYDEARSVLYGSNTFVSLDFATFAAYFGLTSPRQAYIPRSTEPDRLRAIQAITKVELNGQVGDKKFMGLLEAGHLIRTRLGCLTSLAGFELNLEVYRHRRTLSLWPIDDCMLSKPSSLRKLVVDVQTFTPSDADLWKYKKATSTGGRMLATEKGRLVIAKEIMSRMLKQEGFCDSTGLS